jgi:type II secretion system protein J
MMRNSKSFTLIELLIALSIFAVIAVTLYSTFFAGISVWRRSGEGSDAYQDMRTAFDDIARDLKNMAYFTKNKDSIYAFSGLSKEIILMTLEEGATEKMEPSREVVKVSYLFDEAKGELNRRAAGIASGFDLKKAGVETLLKGVADLKFEYCYDSGDEDEPYLWQEEWKDENAKTPRGVRITASIKSGKMAKEMPKVTRVVFIPTGVLGKKEL